jgi:hypothetical protein
MGNHDSNVVGAGRVGWGHDAFHRGFNRLTPETLKAINDLVVQAAVDLGLEDGQKLRVDTTVVQTDIHHPTDNTLLWDVVRVVTRLIGRLAAALGRRRIKGFRDRTRSARRRMQEIQRMTSRQRQDHQTGTYRELIGIAEELMGQSLHSEGAPMTSGLPPISRHLQSRLACLKSADTVAKVFLRQGPQILRAVGAAIK